MSLNHNQLIAKGKKWKGTALKYPFDPDLPVLFVGSKMFALFGKTGESESVNLKADPEEAWLLRQQYPGTVLPGYHMNKRHWNTVLLNGEVPDGELLAMLEQSYRLAWGKLTKREREDIQ
ncbi:MmcQ/YjbR family DNA-binding protein [Cohnella endophytica]|uniref:MmcQ/YjbR family DNA-binding protein n=1 Tax=Cohnella endophytica TaxID=2419778 RepID=A0A494X960_9BACL|nr:MmcQ/YjbR family DNA-binding protein [Cohnella endophytica]RKP47267.1 MmcQ/YjbR family DNA-binding protein [Cohnella endophytica]